MMPQRSSYAAVVDGMRRLTLLVEQLLERATLTDAEANRAREEIQTRRDAVEQLDALLSLRRQQMRPM